MKNRIGIRREDKYHTEKRTPLTPDHITSLVRKYGLEVQIESSEQRIFSDNNYHKAGAHIIDELTDCNIVFGVKEIPTERLIPNMAYCFFSHTIKGQSYNMPMLKRILDLRDTLVDYEKVVTNQGKRLIFFGRYAGYAGIIDTLWALGRRLNWEGIINPFSMIKQALTYKNLLAAKESIKNVGRIILENGLDQQLVPMIFGFTGYGQVSKGAQEIFDLLPFREIKAHELEEFIQAGNFSKDHIYKIEFKEEDMFQPKDLQKKFDLQDYYDHPEEYNGIFNKYTPYLTAIINGIYWEPKYPKLVTKSFLKSHFQSEKKISLKIIGDITCDVNGSIECNCKATNSENPVYVYNPISQSLTDGIEGKGVVILAVDKLPAELPREASQAFGDALLPFVPKLAQTDFRKRFEELEVPEEIRGAIIVHHGKLTPNYRYLSKFIKQIP